MSFQLQTVLTTKCSLNCKYCYMRVNKNPHSDILTPETYKLTTKYIPKLKNVMIKYYPEAKYQFKDDCIAFFGGEPLLELDNMLKIRDYSLQISPYSSSFFPTNGSLLTKEIEDKVLKNNISFGISYDGPYDNQRGMIVTPYLIEVMKTRGCKIMVSPENVRSLYKNFLFFINNGIFYPDFTLVRDNVWTKESLNTLDEQLSQIDEYISLMYSKSELPIIGFYSLYILDTIINVSMHTKRKYSCFSGTGGCAIFGDGDVYPCARFGSEGKYKIGNLFDDTIDSSVIEFFTKETNILNNSQCKQCELYDVCNMGCHYSQLEYGNGKNVPVECVCKALKICYKHAYNFYSKYKQDIRFENYIRHTLSRGN